MLNNQMNILFKTFEKYPLDEIGLNIYALADAAQDKKFLTYLNNLRIKCLLKEASGEKAREISPHLIALPKDFESIEWSWISKNISGTPQMTIIVTKLSFEELYDHLRKFLEVRFEGGLEMILAFWDPLILATLIGNNKDKKLYVAGPVLDYEQSSTFLGPVQSWWYWDRLGELQVLFGLNKIYEHYEKNKIEPLVFSAEQEELMVEATFPDNIIYYLKLNNSFLIREISDIDLYDFVTSSIPEARLYGLSGTRDILNFICLKLIYGNDYLNISKVNDVLNLLKNKKIDMDEAMKLLVVKAS